MRLPPAPIVAALLLLAPRPASAQRTDAIVFIRVFATARAEGETVWKKTFDRSGIEIGTGSGFLVSAAGYIVTNHHVVSGEDFEVRVDGRPVKVNLSIERIEAVFASGQQFEASLVATDPASDLAVLSIGGGSAFPYVPLGDSDAVSPGARVDALGFPFGRALEIGRARAPDVSPAASVTAGTVSAIRAGDDGQPRYLQFTNAINPGNSGGPIVDAEGYALGVVQMKAARAEGIGFAIAINRVKDFLERNGLDTTLPSRRLALGPPASFAAKGLRLRMPYGFQDESPFRLRIEASSPSTTGIALHVDRVASRLSLAQLERGLLDGWVFGTAPFEADAERTPDQPPQRVAGRARGVGALRTQPARMLYLLAEIGDERIVARYVGPAEQVAFNTGALVASLASIEADAMLGPRAAPPARWSVHDLPAPAGPAVPLPAGWVREPDAPLGCRGRVAAAYALAASPPRDYTQSLRAAWWPTDNAADASALCLGPEVPVRDGAYRFVIGWAGMSYRVEGQFLRRGDVVVQIEAVAPDERGAGLAGALAEWRRALEAR